AEADRIDVELRPSQPLEPGCDALVGHGGGCYDPRRRCPSPAASMRAVRAIAASAQIASRGVSTVAGPFFEDLRVGDVIATAPGLTLTDGHAALHQAIVGER